MVVAAWTDRHDEHYVSFEHRVLRDGTVPATQRLMYALIQSYAFGNGWCYRSHAQLAHDYGATHRQVERLIASLVARGMLLERHYRGARGRAKAYAPIVGCSLQQLADLKQRLEHRAQPDLFVELSTPNPTEMSGSDDPNPTEMSGSDEIEDSPTRHICRSQPDIFVAPNPTNMSPVKDTVKDTGETGTPAPDAVTTPEAQRTQSVTGDDGADAPAGTREAVKASVTSETTPAEAHTSRGDAPISKARAAADPRVDEAWGYYRQHIQPSARVFDRAKIAARLQTFSLDELKRGIDKFAADWWWMEKNAGNGANWFFRSDAQVDRWLNLPSRRERTISERALDPADFNRGRTGPTGSRNGPVDQEWLEHLKTGKY